VYHLTLGSKEIKKQKEGVLSDQEEHGDGVIMQLLRPSDEETT